MRMRFLMALALAGALLAGGASAEEKCKLGRFVTFPMAFDEAGAVTVPMTVAGQEQRLLIDTGGVFSMLTEGSAKRLGLRPEMMHLQWMTMFGGRKLDHYVEAPLTIAGVTIKNRAFVLIPDDQMPASDDGILAPDILAVFDVDFDFAASKLSLFSQDHCEGQVVYWTHDPYAVVPFKLDEGRHIKLQVTLDGKKVKAYLDTGASQSVMSLESAADAFGLDAEVLKKAGGKYQFKTLSLEGVTVNNPNILLIPDDKSKVLGGYNEPELLIGIGILRRLHMYMAFKEHNLYVTPADAH